MFFTARWPQLQQQLQQARDREAINNLTQMVQNLQIQAAQNPTTVKYQNNTNGGPPPNYKTGKASCL